MVVTGGIEALPLLGEARRIELGVEDSLLVVERAGEIRAVGTEDRAAAPAEDVAPLELVEKREVRRIRARPLEVARRDHEGPRLAGDVDERRLPGIAVVGRRGDVELDARLVEREARERHVVLPADQAADPPDRRLERAQPAPVALAPDQALVVRRHELPVVERELARGRVVEERVVDRARTGGVDLVDPGDEPDAVLAGDRAQSVGIGARHLERLSVQERERRLRARIRPAGERLRPRRGRIGGNERLREDDEPRARCGGLGRAFREPVERRSSIEDRGLDLAARDGQRLAHAVTPRAWACSRSFAAPRRSAG